MYRITGGTETGINQYPWMGKQRQSSLISSSIYILIIIFVAMLLYSNRFYCGASLINDRYVMGEC